MNIMVMADLVPPADKDAAYVNGDINALMDQGLWKKIAQADLNILNLECPLTDEETPIPKWGACLKASPASVAILEKIPNLLVNLANNHIKDYGEQGIRDTIRLLDERQIPYVGICGDHITQREKIIQLGVCRIGVHACTEHEFSVTEGECLGAVPCCEGDDIFRLQRLAEICDYVIVLYHGGIEFYPYPTPEQQKRLRHYAEAGADLVVCQHSHCIGCMEEHAGGTIVYGQGNFLFAPRKEIENNIADPEMWKHGMMIGADPEKRQLAYYFYEKRQGRLYWTVDDQEYRRMLLRSRELGDEKTIQRHFSEYCERNQAYMSIFRKSYEPCKHRILTRMKQAVKVICGRGEPGEREYLRIYDYLSCEGHLELLRQISRRKLDEAHKKEG